MDDRNEPVEWDYFLTNYERDLLQMSIEDAMRKYPCMSMENMAEDLHELMQNHQQFIINNGQN